MDDDFSLKSDILDRTYLYRFAVRKDSLLSHQENSDYFQSTKDESYNHSRIRVNCTAKDYYLPGLYIIGYGKGKIIFEIPAFLQIEQGKSRGGKFKTSNENKNKKTFLLLFSFDFEFPALDFPRSI